MQDIPVTLRLQNRLRLWLLGPLMRERLSFDDGCCVLGVLPGMPSHRLLESYFLSLLADKGTVTSDPLGVSLKGGVQQHSRSP